MGILCCKETQSENENILAPEEKEVAFASYASSNDKMLQKAEVYYNLLTHLQLIYFVNQLETFTIETATLSTNENLKTNFSSKDEFLGKEMSIDEFQSFIENRILKQKQLYSMAGEDEKLSTLFKEEFLEIYKSLELKLSQNAKAKGQGQVKLTKKHILAMGLLFCKSSNIGKLKLLFDILSDDKKQFTKSEAIDELIMSLFLISSYCMITARVKIGKNNSKLPELSKEELKQAINVSELKDNQALLKYFNESFFAEKTSYSFEEFKAKFEDKESGYGWLLSSKGNRKMLETHNV